MAMAMQVNGEQGDVTALSWDNCPSELLLLLFEAMPAATLATCMFVNSKWKRLVEYVAKHGNKWKDIVNATVMSKGDHFTIKSKAKITWRQIYYNYILWNNIDRANIYLHQIQRVVNIKQINIYRDNLIVVTNKNVRYYHVESLKIIKTVDLTCRDFVENDYMIAVAQENDDKYIKLELFKKKSMENFNLDRVNVCEINKVMFYKVDCNRCYVLNHRNILFVYATLHFNWEEVFSARHYGSSYESCCINVFHDQAYLMLNTGMILWADMDARCFRKVLHIKAPFKERTQTFYCKMFHRYGFVFGASEKEKASVDRFTLFKNNVFVYHLPKVTCVTQHGDILFIGYTDGTIEFLIPRDLSKTKPLRRLNIKDMKKDLRDTEVQSIEVYEDVGIQHLYIATNLEIFHLHISHFNCEEYMWGKYTNMVSLNADESADGLAFQEED